MLCADHQINFQVAQTPSFLYNSWPLIDQHTLWNITPFIMPGSSFLPARIMPKKQVKLLIRSILFPVAALTAPDPLVNGLMAYKIPQLLLAYNTHQLGTVFFIP